MPRPLEYPLSAADVTSGTGSVTGLAVTPVGRSGDLWIAAYLTIGGDPTAHVPPGNDWSLIGDTGLINATLRLSVWRKRSVLGSFPVRSPTPGASGPRCRCEASRTR